MTKTRHNCCNVGSLLCQPCTRPRFHRMSPSTSPAIEKGPWKHHPSFHTCGHQSNHSCTRWHIHTFTQNSNVKEKNYLYTVIYHWGTGSAPCSSSRITSDESGSEGWYLCPPSVSLLTYLTITFQGRVSQRSQSLYGPNTSAIQMV